LQLTRCHWRSANVPYWSAKTPSARLARCPSGKKTGFGHSKQWPCEAPLLACLGTKAPLVDIGLIHLIPVRRSGSMDQPWQESLEKLEKREIDFAMLPLRLVPRRFAARRL